MTTELQTVSWLDDVIDRCKRVVVELGKVTLYRYREVGKIIIESGYRKGQWRSAHRQRFMDALSISQRTFNRLVQLGEMDDQEFSHNVTKFVTFHAWANQSAIAHVGHATGETEWYTPPCYIHAARTLMGTIDLDPASSSDANQIVQATRYFTVYDDGLTQPWQGNVWMNPPYAQPLVTQFCNRLVEQYVTGNVQQACVLVNNATETGFYQNMLKHCQAVCFIAGRVKFLDKNGDASGTPLQGQTILYFGPNGDAFHTLFREFGVVLHAA